MADRTVIIADARQTEDGKRISTKYHLDDRCLRDNALHPLRLEVNEQTALAFGHTLCIACKNRELTSQLSEFIKEHTPGLESAVAKLPNEFEVRIYYHDPERTQPRKVWSSYG